MCAIRLYLTSGLLNVSFDCRCIFKISLCVFHNAQVDVLIVIIEAIMALTWKNLSCRSGVSLLTSSDLRKYILKSARRDSAGM